MTIPPVRRCVLAAFSALLAIALLRPFIADALCVRGDEFLRLGDPAAAAHYYSLALAGDPDCETANERFVFASLEIHTRKTLDAAVKVADAYLTRHTDRAIAIDRALALWSLNDLARAAKEFRTLGDATHDRRFTRLAQLAILRTKRVR